MVVCTDKFVRTRLFPQSLSEQLMGKAVPTNLSEKTTCRGG